MNFKIEHDYEFYCYLKHKLPKKYKITAEPSPNYYSEFLYDYRINDGLKTVETVKGSFKDLKSGELVEKANMIIKTYNK